MPPRKKIELIKEYPLEKTSVHNNESFEKVVNKEELVKKKIPIEEESIKEESAKKKKPIEEDSEKNKSKKKPIEEDSDKNKSKKKSSKSSTLLSQSSIVKSNDDNELINLSLNNTKKTLLILLEEVRVLELKLEEKNEEVKIIYKNFKELLEKIQIPDNIKSKNNELIKVLSESDNAESD